MGHWDDARDLQVGEWGTKELTGAGSSPENWPLLFPSFLLPHTHNFLASSQWPTGGTKRASFFPMLLHVCDTTFSPLAQLWHASLQPLACFLTFSSPDCHPFPYWSGQDFTLSNWSLYFQLSFCMLLTHHADDGGSIHLWNVGLLLWNYMSLQPRKLSSTYSLLWKPEISHFLHYFFMPHIYSNFRAVSQLLVVWWLPIWFNQCYQWWS
jgi:hypothetical protein